MVQHGPSRPRTPTSVIAVSQRAQSTERESARAVRSAACNKARGGRRHLCGARCSLRLRLALASLRRGGIRRGRGLSMRRKLAVDESKHPLGRQSEVMRHAHTSHSYTHTHTHARTHTHSHSHTHTHTHTHTLNTHTHTKTQTHTCTARARAHARTPRPFCVHSELIRCHDPSGESAQCRCRCGRGRPIPGARN